MPTFAGRFEYLVPGRGAVRAGDCQLSFDDRAVTLVADGPPLAFDLGDIDAYEPGQCQVRLSLFNGHDLVLTRFAKAFSDMDRQLREAYRDRLVQCLLVSDLREAARFTGRVTLESPVRQCGGPSEIRLYDSNLAVLPDAGVGFQWRLADIDRVVFDEANYAVTFVRGGERLSVGRLAKRTGELADRAQARMIALKERSARALHVVFPFLGPEPFARVAAAMPEGRSVSIADLGAVHPLIRTALLETVVAPGLRPYVSALAGRAASPWFAGFKVVRQEAGEMDGGAVDVDDTTPAGPGPTAAAAEGPGDEAVGENDTCASLDVGDGLAVLFWYFFPLAAAGGAPSHLALEATTRGGRATYVFHLPPGQPVADGVGAINRGLASLDFRREPIYLDDLRLATDRRYRHYAIALRKLPDLAEVRRSLVGRAIHTTPGAWSKQLDALLAR